MPTIISNHLNLIKVTFFSYSSLLGDKCGRFGDKGYLFHSKTVKKFDEAEEYCKGLGMRMVKVHNAEHNVIIFYNLLLSD